MYPTGNVDPSNSDVKEFLVEVEDDQRGQDAANKARQEHPTMTVLYWGLKDHSMIPLPPLGALVSWDKNTTV